MVVSVTGRTGVQRKAQFFIITAVLVSGALMVMTSMFTSTANIDYTDVLSRHDTDIVRNVEQRVQDTWWNPQWLYRTSVTIQEQSGAYIENQSVQAFLPITRDSVNADCSDIRVIDDGESVAWNTTTGCDLGTYDSDTTAVARYRLDDSSGQWVNDSTGNGHDGIRGGDMAAQSSDPEWTSGRYGSGLRFDGSNDFVEITNTTELNGGSDLTLSAGAWFQTEGPNGADPIVTKQWDASDGDWGLLLEDSCPSWGVCTGSPPYIGYYSEANSRGGTDDYERLHGPVPLNTWNHGMVVIDQSEETLTIYLNGEPIVTETNIGEVSMGTDGHIYLGARYYENSNPQHFFNGRIDDVRLYDKTLTPGQVKGIYENGIGLNISTNLMPEETKTFHVYHGNLFATQPQYNASAFQHLALSDPPVIVNIDPTRSQSELFTNLEAGIERLDQQVSPDIGIDVGSEGCVDISLRSSRTRLEKTVC